MNADRNELLRAMDLRLAALRDELASAFCQVTGTSCSPKELTNLQMFSHYFGAMNIRYFRKVNNSLYMRTIGAFKDYSFMYDFLKPYDQDKYF